MIVARRFFRRRAGLGLRRNLGLSPAGLWALRFSRAFPGWCRRQMDFPQQRAAAAFRRDVVNGVACGGTTAFSLAGDLPDRARTGGTAFVGAGSRRGDRTRHAGLHQLIERHDPPLAEYAGIRCLDRHWLNRVHRVAHAGCVAVLFRSKRLEPCTRSSAFPIANRLGSFASASCARLHVDPRLIVASVAEASHRAKVIRGDRSDRSKSHATSSDWHWPTGRQNTLRRLVRKAWRQRLSSCSQVPVQRGSKQRSELAPR